MRCERCGADTHVETHAIDGYHGRLCGDCRRRWNRLVDECPR